MSDFEEYDDDLQDEEMNLADDHKDLSEQDEDSLAESMEINMDESSSEWAEDSIQEDAAEVNPDEEIEGEWFDSSINLDDRDLEPDISSESHEDYADEWNLKKEDSIEENGREYPFDQTEWWYRGLRAIEDNVDMKKEDYLDKGYEEGEELDKILREERAKLFEEFKNDFYSDN